MKIKKEQQLREKGITLIALVITIIILLILAGITIGLVAGDNGILTQASKAQEKTVQAQEEENIKLAIMASSIENNGYAEILNAESFEKELKNIFGNQELNVTSNGDGSFIITVNDRKYYVNNDKTLINNDNIIEIGTVEELKAFRDDVNSGNSYEGKVVLLTSNINLSGEEWEPIGLYPMENSTPSDETNKPFKGTFDGNGHKIDGLQINTTDKVQGLFGLVTNGKILNLTIGGNSSINGGSATGGIVGYSYNGTIINNCYNYANVTGNSLHTGGISGIIVENCYIINSQNYGNIVGKNMNTGGIAGGIQKNSLVENCSNNGYVLGTESVGGITGTNAYYTSIDACFNSGKIDANSDNQNNNSNVGGIIGLNLSSVSNCYNIGEIIGKFNNAGGIIGLNRGILKNSYNAGNVDSTQSIIGSVVGNNNEFFDSTTNMTYTGTIDNCYALEGSTNKLFGENTSVINENCSFKNSDELKSLYNILGNTFREDLENVNNGYPILFWQ